jgi:hypothetical protein
MATRNDARLWAHLCEEFYAAGATSPEARGRHARRAVALVRRERAAGRARTFAPGDEIPYDVTRAYDLDGDTWERQGAPPDTLKDTWKMPGFDPDRHESAAGGCYVTPHLLDQYGPLTEMPSRKRAGEGGTDG